MSGMKGLLLVLLLMGYTTAPLFDALDAMLQATAPPATEAQTADVPPLVEQTVAPLFGLRLPAKVFNVPISWWGAAVVGAVMSLFFGPVSKSRVRFYGDPLAAAVFGVASAVLAGDGFDWEWVVNNGPMACLVSAGIARWWLSPVIERGTRFIHESNISLPFLKRKDDRS